jgi:hypothetical protein
VQNIPKKKNKNGSKWINMDQHGSKSHEASQNIREHFAKDGAFFRKQKKYRTVRNYSEHTGNEARNR